MTKTVLIILAVLAVVGGGVWFYFKSITQSSDINYIGVPGQIMPPTRDPGSSVAPTSYPTNSTRPTVASPSATTGRPNPYIGPADRAN